MGVEALSLDGRAQALKMMTDIELLTPAPEHDWTYYNSWDKEARRLIRLGAMMHFDVRLSLVRTRCGIPGFEDLRKLDDFIQGTIWPYRR